MCSKFLILLTLSGLFTFEDYWEVDIRPLLCQKWLKTAQNRSKWFILLLYCLFKFGDMDMGPLPRQNDGRAKSLFTIYNHMANWFLGEKEGCCNVKA